MARSQLFRFADLLTDLAGLDTWLTDLGVPIRRNDRFHQAIEVLRNAEAGFRQFRETGRPIRVGSVRSYYISLAEAVELHDIYTAFRDDRSAQLAAALCRAFSGPSLPQDETDKNTDGRNIGFELALAAELKLAGVPVRIAEPDFWVTLGQKGFCIACKRPARQDGIRAAT